MPGLLLLLVLLVLAWVALPRLLLLLHQAWGIAVGTSLCRHLLVLPCVLLLLEAALAVDCSSALLLLLLLLLLQGQLKGGRHVGCDPATARLFMLQQLL
jgi:hypothetical protein